MKKILLLFFLLITFTLASCNKENLEEEVAINSTVEQELAELKAQNELLKNELENINNSKKEEIKKLEKKEPYIPTQEEIKLAWCEITKKVWDVEWCMKNSELIKEVEWYENNFSRSVQNDSWYRWIYENDNEYKFYTYEYLEKACWITEDEWLITNLNVKDTCPCPSWYHIPTTKDIKTTFSLLKENSKLFIEELALKNTLYRLPSWDYGRYSYYFTNENDWKNLFTLSFFDWNYIDIGNNKYWKFNDFPDKNSGYALSLRCIKNK